MLASTKAGVCAIVNTFVTPALLRGTYDIAVDEVGYEAVQPASRFFRGCSKVNSCPFALAVSIRPGLASRSTRQCLSRTVGGDEEKSKQGDLI